MNAPKVLIVDDSATDLSNLKQIVGKASQQVFTATSGEEAIRKAEAEHPSIIFLDIVMDGIDGYRACREISRNPSTQDIPIVFISSKNQKADAMWALKQGGKALISKPYSENQILDQIAALT